MCPFDIFVRIIIFLSIFLWFSFSILLEFIFDECWLEVNEFWRGLFKYLSCILERTSIIFPPLWVDPLNFCVGSKVLMFGRILPPIRLWLIGIKAKSLVDHVMDQQPVGRFIQLPHYSFHLQIAIFPFVWFRSWSIPFLSLHSMLHLDLISCNFRCPTFLQIFCDFHHSRKAPNPTSETHLIWTFHLKPALTYNQSQALSFFLQNHFKLSSSHPQFWP